MRGDVYTDKDGHRYIELSRSGDTIRAVMIRDDWPFPSPPVIFKRKDLTKAPSRYLGGAVIDDDKEALL